MLQMPDLLLIFAQKPIIHKNICIMTIKRKIDQLLAKSNGMQLVWLMGVSPCVLAWLSSWPILFMTMPR